MKTETLMDVSKILAKLRQERERIDESIVSLERLAGASHSGPPPWVRVHKRRDPPPGRSVSRERAEKTALRGGDATQRNPDLQT